MASAQLNLANVNSASVNSASVAGRYGSAIFDLARDSGSLPEVEKQLLALKQLLQGSEKLLQAMASPVISSSDKAETLQALASKAKWSKMVINFIGIACDNGRASELIDMVDGFLALVAHSKGNISASAKTAQALSAKQKTNLATGLKKAFGRNVKLKTEVDPRLLGGLVVQVGSVMFDGSIKSQLEGLKLAMKES